MGQDKNSRDLLVSGSKKNIFEKIKYALLASSTYRDA
jgi:hypothetical protein